MADLRVEAEADLLAQITFPVRHSGEMRSTNTLDT